MTVYVYPDLRGEWRWRLVSGNGRVIADGSEGYTTKDGCEDAVARVAAAFSNGYSLVVEP